MRPAIAEGIFCFRIVFIEGSIAPVSCLEGGSSVCDREDQCMTLYVWEGLEKVIAEYLDSITLQDILDRHRKDYTFDFII